MTSDALAAALVAMLEKVAPGGDYAALDPSQSLRDGLDLDSMDLLFLTEEIHAQLGVEVPELDMPKLDSIDDLVGYLGPRLGG